MRAARCVAAGLVTAVALAGCSLGGTAYLLGAPASTAPSGHVPELGPPTGVTEEPCPDSSFDCVTMPVPVDHFAAHSPTWNVTFALHRGAVDRRGVLVIATGGPGSSGIADADRRLGDMAKDLTDHYDVVFFDQRGIGLSQPFRCDDTLDRLHPAAASGTMSPADRENLAATARSLVDECFWKAGARQDTAGRYSTRQAAEDLETFRRWLGADRLILYGESYGTEYQQTYAAAHPDHVAELLLDGSVDLTTDWIRFAQERARAQSDILAAALAGCDGDPACADDAPGTALAAYDQLAQGLRAAPRPYDYPLADGTTQHRTLTLTDLQHTAAGSLSTRTTRMLLQRALNTAVQGDLVPLARLSAVLSGDDPETLHPGNDPAFSDALFLAVECADHDFVPAGSSPRKELDRWLDAAAKAGVDGYRLPGVYYSDLTCLFWPRGAEHPARPKPVTTPPAYPVLLLTSTTDPNTPTVDSLRLARRLGTGAAMVSVTGGPHVVYGRGDPCVDGLVNTLIQSGQLPPARVTVCPGKFSDTYRLVPPQRAAGYADPGDTAEILLSAVFLQPTFVLWEDDEIALACDAGGSLHYAHTGSGTTATLTDCAWTPGVPVNGTVAVQDNRTGGFSMSVTMPFAQLTLAANGRLTGTFRGRTLR